MFIFQKDNKGFQTWTVTDAVWEESHLSFLTTLLGLSLMTQWLGIHLKAGVTGNAGLIPEVRRSSGGGNGNPLQNTCQNSPKDKEDWWATVPGVTKSQTWLSDRAHMHNSASSKEPATQRSDKKCNAQGISILAQVATMENRKLILCSIWKIAASKKTIFQ